MLYSVYRSFLEEDGSELVGRGKWPCGLLTLGKSTVNVLTSDSLYLLWGLKLGFNPLSQANLDP